MTTGSTYAVRQPESWLTCYPIRPGDTAARLAQRFTGNAVQPAPALVSYRRADDGDLDSEEPLRPHPGRVARVRGDGDAERRISVAALRGRHLESARAVAARCQASADSDRPQLSLVGDTAIVAVSGLVLAWVVARKYIVRRQACLETMKGFGDRFISEFERPLFRRCADEPRVRSRLRFAPRRHRLEVLLAPADGRTYPNLSDHRRNVEYDVERVLRLLRNAPFKNWSPLFGGTVGRHPLSPRNRQATGRCAVNILLLSSGGGGGNILRSLKALFRRDLIVNAEDRCQVRGAAQTSRDHSVSRHE